MEETATEENISFQTGGRLFSPEGIFLMLIAAALDLTSLILVCFGVDDFGITDIIGIFIIGTWMYIRSGTVGVSQRVEKKATSLLRKLFRRGGRLSKILTPIIGEIIPYIGAFPCWTLAVYYELTS